MSKKYEEEDGGGKEIEKKEIKNKRYKRGQEKR
jgi:hypothetical protein